MQWFSIRDVGLLAKLPASAAIATIVPPDRWEQLTDWLELPLCNPQAA